MVFKELIKAFVTHLFWILISVGILLILATLLGCSHQSRIKIYKIDAAHGRLVRSLSDKDVLSFEDAHGYFCTSPRDLERLAEEMVARKNECEEKN